MISRRSLLGTSVVVGVGAAAMAGAAKLGRLDDIASGVGIRPRPQPDQRDVARVDAAAADVARLLAQTKATATEHTGFATALSPLISIGEEHLAAVTGSTTTAPTVLATPSESAEALAKAFAASADRRANDAVEALAPEVALLLASMSASHRQCAQVVRRLA